MKQGKYTVDTFAKKQGITRQSALNLLSKLKREGYVSVSGGGRQKRIYTIHKKPEEPVNGFYTTINKYSPEKLAPAFKHYVIGRYTIEHAIIDGIKIGDVRTMNATQHLFRHITSWKRLFDLAKKHDCVEEVRELYKQARNNTRVKRMPKRYES